MLEILLEKPKNKVLAVLFLSTLVLFFIFTNIIFDPLLSKFPERKGLLAMKNAWTIENMEKIFNSWTPDLFELIKIIHIWDFVFMAVYGTLLASGILLVARGLKEFKKIQKIYLIAFLLPLVAVILDVIEGIHIFIMLSDPTNINEINAFGASLSTTICIAIINTCIVLVFIGFIIAVILFIKNKRKSNL